LQATARPRPAHMRNVHRGRHHARGGAAGESPAEPVVASSAPDAGSPRCSGTFSTDVDGLVDVPGRGEASRLVNEAEHVWNAVAQILRAQVSEAVWFTSFNEARPVRLGPNHLVLTVPSSLVKERIEGRYLPLVLDALVEIGRPGMELHIDVQTQPAEWGDDALALDGWTGDPSLLAG